MSEELYFLHCLENHTMYYDIAVNLLQKPCKSTKIWAALKTFRRNISKQFTLNNTEKLVLFTSFDLPPYPKTLKLDNCSFISESQTLKRSSRENASMYYAGHFFTGNIE